MKQQLKEELPSKVTGPCNVLVVGVGGQGVVMISKVLSTLCQQQGFVVKQSEVHGMAKRGGSVFSHVRFGDHIYSPTIPEGEADIIVALEWAEGLRWLPYLKSETGTLIVDTQQIVPPFACRDRRVNARLGYVDKSLKEIIEQIPNSMAIDAVDLATDAGVPKAANTVLLGALSTALNFDPEAWKAVIEDTVPPKTISGNLQAFESGRSRSLALEQEIPSESYPDKSDATRQMPIYKPRLEITGDWCKSCDICVRFCPERCLRLDKQQIVELFEPDLCTGCRMCEWLCPDFAINVHLDTEHTIESGK
ncbi:MAG TPA: 2-oxoacid:acceptor oxidoreductase family protein [Arenicellales bacterium]|jgi:indolepyruvate ferredoxin oxidoreductase beta subunit|nr:pyruvate ferredoxin oxidoreductase [Gammaproteobacteria bacterium]MDP6025797.1 2-oxoacid:acceptor oxidoreductase family protein [Pseudomonadales bacterium]HJL54166.1 2-oxoacid:acceptor oxidoreductase family protein [Arenicellales bacterium]MDP6314912.1 2-oxoacid:acceptor oxidoreductase family protein [Pseudomonadales bacterium]MDP7314790.1 2-oxoacid:acceptor oxidoreductase family protein [Pseudomonadales bacterium]|tara:strand:+ start:349 stop:1269 length:921 start_codon:yes stop_codon:yes gene_type:complete